eukprot:s2349_g5.t1
MTEPCCAVKVGDFNVLCVFGSVASAWYGYRGITVDEWESEGQSQAPGEDTDRQTRSSDDEDEEELEAAPKFFDPLEDTEDCFPDYMPLQRAATVAFPRALEKDPCRAQGSFCKRRRALVSRFLTDFCQMVWPKLSGAVKKIMDEQVCEALTKASAQLPDSIRGEVAHSICFGAWALDRRKATNGTLVGLLAR